jgi:hypothetical protein
VPDLRGRTVFSRLTPSVNVPYCKAVFSPPIEGDIILAPKIVLQASGIMVFGADRLEV